MITRDKITFEQLDNEPGVPKDYTMLRVDVRLHRTTRVDKQGLPQYRKELKEGLENACKDVLLREVYGEAAEKVAALFYTAVKYIGPTHQLKELEEKYNAVIDALPGFESRKSKLPI